MCNFPKSARKNKNNAKKIKTLAVLVPEIPQLEHHILCPCVRTVKYRKFAGV